MDLFKNSFKLYVKSGLRMDVETDIEMLMDEQGGFSVTKDFKEKFYMFIITHHLRKIQCFYLHSTHLTTFSPIYSPG